MTPNISKTGRNFPTQADVNFMLQNWVGNKFFFSDLVSFKTQSKIGEKWPINRLINYRNPRKSLNLTPGGKKKQKSGTSATHDKMAADKSRRTKRRRDLTHKANAEANKECPILQHDPPASSSILQWHWRSPSSPPHLLTCHSSSERKPLYLLNRFP